MKLAVALAGYGGMSVAAFVLGRFLAGYLAAAAFSAFLMHFSSSELSARSSTYVVLLTRPQPRSDRSAKRISFCLSLISLMADLRLDLALSISKSSMDCSDASMSARVLSQWLYCCWLPSFLKVGMSDMHFLQAD